MSDAATPTDDEQLVEFSWLSVAYYDEQLMAWCCDECGAVLKGDGDCPRCDT